jgi:hypothetical protein
MKNTIQNLKMVTLAILLSLGLNFVYAWALPTAPPPNGNADAPITTKGGQTIKGDLTIGTTLSPKTLNVIGSLRIPGGTPGQVLTATNNTGDTAWAAGGGGSTPDLQSVLNAGNSATGVVNNIVLGGSLAAGGGITSRGYNYLTDPDSKYDSWFPFTDNNAYVTGENVYLRGGSPAFKVALTANTTSGDVYVGGNLYTMKNSTTGVLLTPHGKERFTSSGIFTKPLGVGSVWVTMSGGGGGGGRWSGGASGGGGAQAHVAQKVSSFTSAPTISITVGAGGNGGNPVDGASSGGESRFGTYLSAAGGGAGWSNNGGGGAPGGSGGVRGSSVSGGGSIFGIGGLRGYGKDGGGYGGGGGPGESANGQFDGGNGSPGFVLIEW